MDRKLFKIERVETVKTAFLKETTAVSFVLLYKGVEINRFSSVEAAEDCFEEAVAIRDDAEWAYDEALRNAGYDIPR